MNISKVINDVVDTVSYKTSNGMVDVKDPYHLYLLKEEFEKWLDHDLVNLVLFEADKASSQKPEDYTNIGGRGYVLTKDLPKGWKSKDPVPDKAQRFTKKEDGSFVVSGEDEKEKKQDDPQKLKPTDLQTDSERSFTTKEDGTEADLNNQADVKNHVQQQIIQVTEEVEQMLEDGDIEGARKLAEKLVKDLNLTQPLYLQGDKEGVGKIYVGEKHKKMTGSKTPTVKQKKMLDILDRAGVKVPVRSGAISRTAMSIQQTTEARVTGTVTTIPDKKEGRLVKEIVVGDRKIRLVADPDSDDYELMKLKLNNIQDGEIEFVDIGDTSTKEGREQGINTVADDIEKMFDKMLPYIDKEDQHNISVINNCKELLSQIKEEKDPKKRTELMLELLRQTKIKGPDREQNEFVNMTAYLAESIEVMRHLSNGRETLVPASGNFKTSDVIPLEEGVPNPTNVTVDGEGSGVEYRVIKGTSVKYDGGGASALPEKHLNTIYGKLDREITVKGKKASDTKSVIDNVLDYYPDLFGREKPADKVEMTDEYYKKGEEDLWNSFYEYYPELKDSELKDDMMTRIEKSVETQINRLDQECVEKGEGKEKLKKRMMLYHMSQFVAGAVSNHPDAGMKKQAFANSDYKQKTKAGQPVIEIIESDGVNNLSYVGFTPDKGYQCSKDTGHTYPSNRYSSELKHDNPAEKMIKKYSKK